ncbi:MAG: polysaccharide biosynthesis tyrosine autokinase [Dysgonamonadaceae bacterium]|jgi:capsular exopolysaccharide synthesis family protein|nr:polysaccharide biosynthesis tyrosine autokinase [Dysgonamonadaceae bacterium]
MEINNIQSEQLVNEEVSFAEIFFHYLNYWKWFVFSVILCLFIAFVYLRFTTKEYNISSKVLIKDDKKGQTSLDMNAFSDLGLMPKIGTFDNEIEVLLSKSLLKEVVDSLKIGVSYFSVETMKKQEIYNNTPVLVSVSNQMDWGTFLLNKEKDGSFILTSKPFDFTRKFNIDEKINSPWGILSFKENPFGVDKYPVEVVIEHPKKFPFIQINPINKQATVINISTITAVPQKGMDIINTLVNIYNKKAIDEKNYVATNTIRFIDERLVVISGELKSAERDVESYKRSRGLTDIEAEAQIFLHAQTNYSQKISDVTLQLTILRDIKKFLTSPDNLGNMVPANVGLTDPTILTLIQKYNEEITLKNRATPGMKANNPLLKEYEDRMAILRENLVKGIGISEAGLQTTLQELRKQESMYLGKTMGLSTQERESRELYRQKEIKESLFIYLLQKKEETGLSLALATPNAIVIDSADYIPIPIKPKSKIILFAALLLGIIIPVIVVYIMDLFDNKLRNKEQLTKIIKAPFLGELPKTKLQKAFPVLNVRSGIAEKFRIVASNLDFIVSRGERVKVIMVTSSFSGEGKSFFSQNLAMSLATSGKKTLLIDLDIRKSVLNKHLEMNPKKGVAMFLADPSMEFSEIIDKSKRFHKNLDIIPVKVFPPNPAELLASDRLGLLFQNLKDQYDYIIVDTAPIALVADAFRINQFVDVTIFVTRSDYTYKSSLSDIQLLYKEDKLHNLTVVLNAVSSKKRYGYYYGQGAGKHNYYLEES